MWTVASSRHLASDGASLTPGNDIREAADVQARPADERAVDVRKHDEVVDVVWLDAAAVNPVAAVGRWRAEPAAQAAADVGVRFGRLFRRRVAAGADRPHRLIRDDERVDLIAGQAIESIFDLSIENGKGLRSEEQ